MSARKIQMEGSTLPIREFNLKWMCDNPSIIIIAKRGSGKSILCRSLLKFFIEDRKVPAGMVIAPTDRMNKFYGKDFPDLFVHNEYRTEAMEKLLYRQKHVIEKRKQKAKKGKKVNARCVLLMDDCLGEDKKWKKDQPIREVLFNGRHYKITYILTMQDPLGVDRMLRGNFDYIFVLAEDFVSNQKRVFEHYAGMFPNFSAFQKVFKEITSDYGCMVIANRGPRETFLDKVFWFKADFSDRVNPNKAKQMNKFHKKNYNRGWKTKEANINVETMMASRTKAGTSLIINKENTKP